MKKKDRQSRARVKVSAMVLKVAQGYIDLGKTIQERENFLRSACTAWNIACLPPDKRDEVLKGYVMQFRQKNYSTNEECKHFESDIRQLIDEKLRLYPDVDIRIVDCRIEEINGKDKAWVMSIRNPANPYKASPRQGHK